MKKLFFAVTIIFIVPFTASAQIDIKGGYTYAFQSQEGGLNIGGIYGITEDIDLSAGLSFYFPNDILGLNRDLWMVDIDGHYNFPIATGLKLYPLAGLNFTTFGLEGQNSNTEFGLNLGGGANFQLLEALSAFVEIKYIIGNADQGVFGVGLAYRVK